MRIHKFSYRTVLDTRIFLGQTVLARTRRFPLLSETSSLRPLSICRGLRQTVFLLAWHIQACLSASIPRVYAGTLSVHAEHFPRSIQPLPNPVYTTRTTRPFRPRSLDP